MAKGIDVYTAYQTVTDWGAVRRAGYEFAYVKVSDGLGTRAVNSYGVKGRAAGVKMGAYHYAQFGDAVTQANLLIDQAERHGLTDLAPALDLEHPFVENEQAITFAVLFLKQIVRRGHRPALYANNSMMKTIQGSVRRAVPDTLMWVARYGPQPSVAYDVWQHTQYGHVPGIAAKSVDLNTGIVPLNKKAPAKEEEDMTPDQDTKLDVIFRQISGKNGLADKGWGWPSFVDGKSRVTPVDYLRIMDKRTLGLEQRLAAVTSVLSTLADVVAAKVDLKAEDLLAQIDQSIKDAVIKVDVNIEHGESTE